MLFSYCPSVPTKAWNRKINKQVKKKCRITLVHTLKIYPHNVVKFIRCQHLQVFKLQNHAVIHTGSGILSSNSPLMQKYMFNNSLIVIVSEHQALKESTISYVFQFVHTKRGLTHQVQLNVFYVICSNFFHIGILTRIIQLWPNSSDDHYTKTLISCKFWQPPGQRYSLCHTKHFK